MMTWHKAQGEQNTVKGTAAALRHRPNLLLLAQAKVLKVTRVIFRVLFLHDKNINILRCNSTGVSVTSSNSGVPDISGTVYNKTQVMTTHRISYVCFDILDEFEWCEFIRQNLCSFLPCLQSFDKQGFHAGTPPPFNLPSALGGTGPLNPGGAPGYAPAPFLHILPAHQQPHSQLLHHHLTQDGQVGYKHTQLKT